MRLTCATAHTPACIHSQELFFTELADNSAQWTKSLPGRQITFNFDYDMKRIIAEDNGFGQNQAGLLNMSKIGHHSSGGDQGSQCGEHLLSSPPQERS